MDNFPFAHRTNWCQETNPLSKVREELAKQDIPVLDLTVSNPTTAGFTYPNMVLSGLDSLHNFSYEPETCGMLSAREAVAQYYARRHELILSPHDIILTASTSEAYSFLMRLLVNPGEKVLIPKPSYPLFQYLLEINDVQFEQYPLVYNGQKWCLDAGGLERLVDSTTKAIIVVNPNNPTGSFLNQVEVDFLNELCGKHQLALISDEVFFDYALTKEDGVSLGGNRKALTFVLGGLSKTLGLPQMKCAWILASGPQALLQESLSRLEIIADTYLSVNTPAQNALEFWFDYMSGVQEQITARVQENWRYLRAHLNDHAQLLNLQGGWSATLRLPAIKSEEEWVVEFLREDHVSVYPGYFFDFDRGAYIVLSLLTVPYEFQEAVGRIMKRLSKI